MLFSKRANALGLTLECGVCGASYTSFGSGGKVDYLFSPACVAELKRTLALLKGAGIPYRVIGGGSNLLLPDEGYRGALVTLRRLSDVKICGNTVTADAGAKLPTLARIAAHASLSGVEFACGIPGVVGGAVATNAGAFDERLSDVLVAVCVLTEDGKTEVLTPKDLNMTHHFAMLPKGCVVLSAVLSLKTGEKRQIEETMRSMTERRAATQPRERSAGSVFRRVGETPAAIYIEKTGLKGLRIGGAELSKVHCNFIVNKGGATTADFFAVAEQVKKSVFDLCSVRLTYEVERICSPKRT